MSHRVIIFHVLDVEKTIILLTHHRAKLAIN